MKYTTPYSMTYYWLTYKTEQDMDEHIQLNHCIAINEVREQVMGMIDMPKLPKNKVCKHCLEPPMYCTCIEEIIEEIIPIIISK